MNEPGNAFTIYHVGSGRLLRHVVTSAPAAQIQAGEAYVEGLHDTQGFVMTAEGLRACETMPVRVDGRRIEGLPVPCVVTIEGVRYEVDDGDLELEFAHPGPYTVQIEAAGYVTATVVIE